MKKLLSYLFPITLKKVNSEINGQLEVNLIDGKKTLDTPTSNYSYGSLQKVLHQGLSIIKFDSNVKNVLVLGLGAGSIVDTIRNDFQSGAYIELIDNDPEVINIAKNEFEINQFQNIKIIHSDADVYVKKSSEKFEVIIVDIFIGNVIPKKFTSDDFLNNLFELLDSNGKIIYNTMTDTIPKKTISQIEDKLIEKGLNVSIHDKIEWTNNLIIAQNHE